MPEKELYVEVILPLNVDGTFTYKVPDQFRDRVSRGQRVLVEFGKKWIYSAVVYKLTQTPPVGFRAKLIINLLDDAPIINEFQFQLWDWMASYYMCSLGEVMKAALPGGLKLESETAGTIKHRNRPGTISYVSLTKDYADQEKLGKLLDDLKRAPKQIEVMELLITQMDEQPGKDYSGKSVLKQQLLKLGGTSGAITALVRKGVLEIIEKEEIPGVGSGKPTREVSIDLTLEQGVALDDIRAQMEQHQTILLHGITSSGKTELYIRLINETIMEGRQVLYLLPEIALTSQMINRLKEVFGDQIGVYHSKFSDTNRVRVYRNLAGLSDQTPYPIILGVRSSLFLPFQNLGLIIVDEEHENSYKQHDPAPRYHARDAANILALFHHAKVILGTATPSFETYFNAKRKKFGYAQLNKRFGDVEPPEIVIANSREAKRKKQLVSHFTPELMKAIDEALKNHEQVILFQNRRGYTNFIICDDCGHIPKCRRCDVSLTYHKYSGKLECHYCGNRIALPGSCGQCNNTNLVMKGFGTEKIEDELGLLFEGVRVGRLDTDSARTRKGYEKIVHDFATGKIDILVGTQLIAKGFDFDNVSLVGVLDADSMFNFPDFRSFERSFQMISQVSGRAGRRKKQGKVIVQTSDPEHPVLQYFLGNDYEGLFKEQMEERQLFGYPPYIRMIRLMFKHKVPSILDSGTDLVAKELKTIFGSRLLGPQYPLVRKIQDNFQKQLFLKIEREASYEKAKLIIKEKVNLLGKNSVYRNIRVTIDVDPV